MAEQVQIHIPRAKLGSHGFEDSKLVFGCMGLNGLYNSPVNEEAGIAIIKHAFNRGITFFDNSNVYGPHTNEILLGKALKQLPREKIQVVTKFGIVGFDVKGMVVNGKPEYVRACCEESLERLRVDYIDLYFQHRIDKTVLIEETVNGGAQEVGGRRKSEVIGLSEASPNTIKRAHAVHPITALQMEWSLWTRDIEPEIVPLCRELGIGIVPYSPIGRGFFAGRGIIENLPLDTNMTNIEKFSGKNLEKNEVLYLRVENLAKKHRCSPVQLALAWVLHQGDDVVPIPGTNKVKNLDVNIESFKVKLTKEDVEELSDSVREEEVAVYRSYGSFEPFNWKYADTPPMLANLSA